MWQSLGVGFFLLLAVVGWVVCGFVAGAVWESKGGSFGAGFALGLFLGYLGLFYVAFAKPDGAPGTRATGARDYKTCPRCAEDVRAAAVVCRFCGHEFEDSAEPEKSPEAITAPTFEGQPILNVVPHAFGVVWGRLDDGTVVLKEKDSAEWARYDSDTNALVPPRSVTAPAPAE